ncbi:Rieske (2Fe-2S) protein [Sorangium sp. So ce131]|uniref:Rieske (2Fe-2S) protein n=1 Tax=Sorangium sp. So ce131 TaxID=3133282 RepID=UPI003F61B5C6
MEITLGPVSAIPPGEGRMFEVGSERIAVFLTRDGRVFATQASCPHRGGPLADGLVGGCAVICPLHQQKFNLETGEPLGSYEGLKTYPVRLSATNQIVVKLEDKRAAP